MSERTCPVCDAAIRAKRNKYCSRECSRVGLREYHDTMLTPTSRALRAAQSADDVIAAIKLGVTIEGECWLWPWKHERTYPRIIHPTLGLYTVHRLILEAKLGAPLGDQTGHHTCGNRKCVNPDHLEQATNRENVGEMLARRDYIRRIELLESALRACHPNHPLLDEAPLGGIASP